MGIMGSFERPPVDESLNDFLKNDTSAVGAVKLIQLHLYPNQWVRPQPGQRKKSTHHDPIAPLR